MTGDYSIVRVDASRIDLMRRLNAMFGEVFGDPSSYCSAQPRREYLERLLRAETLVALAAVRGDDVVAGLTAYLLHKLEQERTEVYLYDLAVRAEFRRQGIATKLIETLWAEVAAFPVHVIFVQADHGDDPAVALYSKLGLKEEVLHFDLLRTRSSCTRGSQTDL
ncbi:MAG: GNAT family N-acetyltransferase [Opitutaceae bacterium]|nr:GNAT family N-acetyltransferase [Opitutaceae bacterium]